VGGRQPCAFEAKYRSQPAQSMWGGIAWKNDSLAPPFVWERTSSMIAAA
jgi:hypothetical protein